MDMEDIKQEIIDKEHLRLLGLAHYVSGGITIVFSSFFIIHLVFMSFMFSNPELFPQNNVGDGGEFPAQAMEVLLFVFGMMIFLGVLFGISQIVSGRFMRQRKRKLFSFIVAIPNLLFIPYGTILAIATLIVLERDSIKKLYQAETKQP
jgi:succinate dehydrogenase hydrophobic anchor subunit